MVELTSRELNTLLYLEDCLVNQGGRLEMMRMNQDDWDVIEKMADHITVIRLASPLVSGKKYSHGVTKYDDYAWELSHKERKTRAMRMIDARGRDLDG